MTERIDHAKIATQWASPEVWKQAGGVSDGVIPSMLAMAQVHATLALVEQQRIANLIALGYKYYGSQEDTEGAYANLLKLEIRIALGLEEATGD